MYSMHGRALLRTAKITPISGIVHVPSCVTVCVAHLLHLLWGQLLIRQQDVVGGQLASVNHQLQHRTHNQHRVSPNTAHPCCSTTAAASCSKLCRALTKAVPLDTAPTSWGATTCGNKQDKPFTRNNVMCATSQLSTDGNTSDGAPSRPGRASLAAPPPWACGRC